MGETVAMTLPTRNQPRWIYLLGGLCLAAAVGAIAWWAWPRSGVEADPAPGPLPLVVMVSGYGGDGRDLAPLVTSLEEQGRTVSVMPPVGDNTGDLSEQAEALAAFVQGELDGAEKVDVIGYSAGGVVSRLWVRDYGGDAVARRVLTIAAPHHGTALAGLADLAGLCDGACAQLVPDSELLGRLNDGDETPAGPEWISVWSENDRTVTPPSTAELEGALTFTVQSVCPNDTPGHAQLPASPVITAALSTVLGPGAPTAPRPPDVDCQRSSE
ncbi:MAG: hypothetical protein WA966_04195 [Ornithinimicrobium sp.]